MFVYELSGCGFESSCSQFLALELLSLIQQIHDCGVVVNGVVAVTTAQHHSTKPQLNSGSAQVQIFPASCWIFVMVKIS